MKIAKNKNKMENKKVITSVLLLVNYIVYSKARYNHISYVSIHVTPTLQWHNHQTLVTRVKLLYHKILEELIHQNPCSHNA